MKLAIPDLSPTQAVVLYCPEAEEPKRVLMAYVGVSLGWMIQRTLEREGLQPDNEVDPTRTYALFVSLRDAARKDEIMHYLLRVEEPDQLRDHKNRPVYIEPLSSSQNCSECGNMFSELSTRPPAADLTMCPQCGAIYRVDEALQLSTLTAEERAALAHDRGLIRRFRSIHRGAHFADAPKVH